MITMSILKIKSGFFLARAPKKKVVRKRYLILEKYPCFSDMMCYNLNAIESKILIYAEVQLSFGKEKVNLS
jgi:hypothetical protein